MERKKKKKQKEKKSKIEPSPAQIFGLPSPADVAVAKTQWATNNQMAPATKQRSDAPPEDSTAEQNLGSGSSTFLPSAEVLWAAEVGRQTAGFQGFLRRSLPVRPPRARSWSRGTPRFTTSCKKFAEQPAVCLVIPRPVRPINGLEFATSKPVSRKSLPS